MEPGIFIKQPWEQRKLEFDFTDTLATGDTLASVSGVTVWEGTTDKSATMVSGAPTLSGNSVFAVIIAGTEGTSYWIRVRAITTNGDLVEDDLRLLVRNVGG